MPEFKNIQIEESADGFSIRLQARCRSDNVDFSWSGEIVGSAEGRITFRAAGSANSEFQSPRIGLNVLFGSESLAGIAYEITDKEGKTTQGVFPRPISGPLLTEHWTSLTYRTEEGLELTCRVTGAQFAMEDQRVYCDSSYKAYSALDYPYPQVPQGERREEIVEIIVSGEGRGGDHQGPVRVALGEAIPGAVLPRVIPLENLPERKPFNPAAHMPDEDTLMENLTALSDHAARMRAAEPQAPLRLGPLNFNSPYPRPGPDPRREGRFAAAWAASALFEAARAGIQEVAFDAGRAAQPVLTALAAQGGRPLLATKVFATPPPAVRACGVMGPEGRVLWLVNQTSESQPVLVALPESVVKAPLRRFVAADPPAGAVTETAAVTKGVLRLTLEPYEVCVVQVGLPAR